MMQTRYEIATLLGYLLGGLQRRRQDDPKGANIAKFIATGRRRRDRCATRIRDAAGGKAEDRSRRDRDLGLRSSLYLRGRCAARKYDFDSQSVRPYFPFMQVKQGILDTAAGLFHVTFRQEQNVPAWDPSVETWEVIDNGKAIGRFYLDMHPRPGKYSHAEMVPGARRRARQAASRGHSGLQLPGPDGHRSRSHGVR